MPSEAFAPITDGPAAKRAATVQRKKDERRAECLSQIEAQIADGTLVVRQMTIAEHQAPV
jgi:hypothetical protein